MDNFEWQKGFGMTFGLIAVDRSTLERTPKESLTVLGGIIKEWTNGQCFSAVCFDPVNENPDGAELMK